MRNFTTLMLLVYLISLNVYAADDHELDPSTINMSKVQLYNLGIKIGPLASIHKIPLLNAPGKVVIPPSNEYIVSAAQAGMINKLFVSVGDSIKKGQILAQINSPGLLNLQRQFLKANSDRQLAWSRYQRDKKLFEEGVIAERRWLETRTLYNGFVSETHEAKQLLEIAGMSDRDIKKLSDTRRLSSLLDVQSPIDGVVLERMATAGKRIDILAPLYRIANLETLWLEINIPHENINRIKLGDSVMIDNSHATASIILLGQSVDPNNQTILARAVIDPPDPGIRAGQTVNTQLIQTSDHPVFIVPDAAIAQSDGQPYIFVRTESGFLVKAIEIMGKEDEDTIITGDLNGNEKIAIRGAVALKANWMGLSDKQAGGHGH